MRAERCSASRWRSPVWGNMSRSPTPRATASVCCSRSRAVGMRRSRNSLLKKGGIGFQPVVFSRHSQAGSLCHGDDQQVARFAPGMVRLKSGFLSSSVRGGLVLPEERSLVPGRITCGDRASEWRSRSGPTRQHPPLLQALVDRRGRTCSACDRWLGAQGLFDAIEMAATMHRTSQEARLPTLLDLRHHLR
jgi:hypothetical protein